MASYNKLNGHMQNVDFVSGVLAKGAIYIVAKNYYAPEIHGEDYDEEDYPRQTWILKYAPTSNNKNDEWSGLRFNFDAPQKSISILDKNIAFFTLFHNGAFGIHSQKDIELPLADSFSSFDGDNTGMTDITCVGGEIYASASGGKVFQFTGDEKCFWIEIASSSTKKFFSDFTSAMSGFTKIAGFSNDEIYLGGFLGVFWIKEKDTWRPINLPTDNEIRNIICANDGNVYLNCVNKIFKGRKDYWEELDLGNIDDISKISWYKDKLYILPQFAENLFSYSNGKVEKINTEKISIPVEINDMIANEELLMLTGNESVILFDSNRWFNLFDKNKTEEELREKGTFYDPREK